MKVLKFVISLFKCRLYQVIIWLQTSTLQMHDLYYYYQNIFQFTMTKRKMKNIDFHVPIFKEQLRSRQTVPLKGNYRQNNYLSIKSSHHSVHLRSPLASPSFSHQNSNKNNINWLKYNILVGIYDNWIRLEPLIKYWFLKQYQPKQEQKVELKQYLKKTSNQIKLHQCRQLIQKIQLRKVELKNNILIQDQSFEKDVQYLIQAKQVTKNILSSLPLENAKWTKNKITKQNQYIDDMILNFSEGQFQRNREVIMTKIKERVRFINQMQEKYIKFNKIEKQQLDQKINLLKKPFKKLFSLDSNKPKTQAETFLENLWNQVNQEKPKKQVTLDEKTIDLNKPKTNAQQLKELSISKVQKRYVKPSKKNNEYFFKQRSTHKNRANYKFPKHKANKMMDGDELETNNISTNDNQQLTKETYPNQSSNHSQNSFSQQNSITYIDSEMERVTSKFAENFKNQKKRKLKSKKNKTSILHKKSNLISSGQICESQNQIRNSRFSNSIQKNTVSEQTKQKDYMRSNKRIVTRTNIKSNKKLRITKDYTQKKNDSAVQVQKAVQTGSRFKSISDQIYKQFIKRFPNIRKAKLYMKSRHKHENFDYQFEQASQVQAQLPKHNQIFSYFQKIIDSGLLDKQGYKELKKIVENAVRRHSHINQSINLQKAFENPILKRNSVLDRDDILKQLHQVIKNDEKIRMKIKQEMNIFFDMGQGPQKSTGRNEKYIFHSTQLTDWNQQMRRVLLFQRQGQNIRFGNKLKKVSNELLQFPNTQQI